jgi:hypothetical protein
MRFRDEADELKRRIDRMRSIGAQAVEQHERLRAERSRLAAEGAYGKAFALSEAEKLREQMVQERGAAEAAIKREWAAARAAVESAGRSVAAMRTRYATSESVSRRWSDAVKPLLDAGMGVADAIDTLATDQTALEAIELNLPSYLAAKKGSPNSRELQTAIDEALFAIDSALMPHLSGTELEERKLHREVTALADVLDETAGFALKEASGTATPTDRMKLGIRQGDAERILNGEYVPAN